MVETISKGVLLSAGASESELISLNHRIPDICSAVAARRPGPNDDEYLRVAATMPMIVSSRYKPPALNGHEALDLYRRALFLAAEALRRTNVGLTSLFYRHLADNTKVPARVW